MHIPISFRFRLGTLTVFVGLIVLVLGWIVAQYRQQTQVIDELRRYNVDIYAIYGGPPSLSWLFSDSGIFDRPIQALVLLQPDGENSVRILDKSVIIEDLPKTLAEFQRLLKSRLGLRAFALVTGFQQLPDRVSSALFDIQVRYPDLRFHMTPCGIENFRYVSALPPEAFGPTQPRAQQSHALEPAAGPDSNGQSSPPAQ